ncbi:MAG: hypothetical protein AUI17_07970 [Acidobacteriales bacterium 13_2_20CM_2_55_5]|nr:MAG: hypothetical protein AUI17_07970 [Acidobacteriales bacterium 13_2_20CM_2_55_5]
MSLLAVDTLFAATDLKVIVSHKSWAENLAELLRFVAEQYRVPIVAELVNPVPSHLVIESGQDTAIGLLGNVLKQLPGYKYEVTNGQIIHFYAKHVVNAKGNLLNIRIKHFTMPNNLSDFKLLLPAAINSSRKGLPTSGAVISGFPSSEMEKEKLQTRGELTAVSGRDLLMAVAEETRGFYTIIVLQDQNCRTDTCFDYANDHWFWGPLTATVSHDPIYIQQPRLR